MKLKWMSLSVIGLVSLQPSCFPQAAGSPQPLLTHLETIDAHKSNLVKVDRNTAWKAYKFLTIDPTVYEPANPDHRLQPLDVEKVCRTMDTSLARVLGSRTIAGGNGEDGSVLKIKPVITEIERTNTLANIVSFIAFQVTVSYGAAAVRFELFDASTGRQVGEITSHRNARPWNVYPWNFYQSFTSLGQSEAILRNDSRKLRRDFDRLTKMSPLKDGTVGDAE